MDTSMDILAQDLDTEDPMRECALDYVVTPFRRNDVHFLPGGGGAHGWLRGMPSVYGTFRIAPFLSVNGGCHRNSYATTRHSCGATAPGIDLVHPAPSKSTSHLNHCSVPKATYTWTKTEAPSRQRYQARPYHQIISIFFFHEIRHIPSICQTSFDFTGLASPYHVKNFSTPS